LAVCGVGILGFGGVTYTWQGRTFQYETLLTPDEWGVYACWYPTLVLEGFFCAAQLFPYYRARPIVQSGEFTTRSLLFVSAS